MNTAFYTYSLRIQRKPIIVILVIILLVLYSIASGGFRLTSDIDFTYQFSLALSFSPVIVLTAITLLLSSSITPEQHHLVEVNATQPYTYRQTIRNNVLVSCLVIIILMIFYLLGAVFLMSGKINAELIVTFIGNVIFLITCTGFILFSIMAGRDARFGQVSGLLLFIILTQVPIPDNLQHFNPITFQPDNLSSPIWWLSRFCYMGFGITLTFKALKIASNTDYLLIGTLHKHKRTLPSFLDEHSQSQSRIQRIIKDLPLPIIIVLYEAFIILRQGFIVILFVVASVFITLILLGNIREIGFTDNITYTILSTTYSIIIIITIFLPFLTIDGTWRDAESGKLDVHLSLQSHRQYLGYKSLGISLAIGISVILGSFLPYILGVVALFDNIPLFSNFTLAYWGIVSFGLVPGAIYLSVMGFFIGATFHHISIVILRAGILIICILLQFATIPSLVGNIIYPTGMMTSTTTLYWYRQFLSVIFASEKIPETVVSMPILILPLLSAILQMLVLWLITSHLFAYTIRQR